MSFDTMDKYSRFKRSASLSNCRLQDRFKKVNNIYRSLTSDKMRSFSQSKSQKHSTVHTPEKRKNTPYMSPFYSQNMNQLT